MDILIKAQILGFGLFLVACSSSSNNQLFGRDGSVDTGADAGGFGGQAGSSGGSAGAAGASGSGGSAGSVGSGDSGSCEGVSDGFLACQSTGCHVCVENVTSYPKYFENHPNCIALSTCISGVYGVCSKSCPPPSSEDQ